MTSRSINKIPDGRKVGNDSNWNQAVEYWRSAFNQELFQHEQETANATLNDGFYVTGRRSEIIIKYLHEFFHTIISDIRPTDGFLISLTGSGGRRQISYNSDVDITLIFENLHANELFNENLKVRIAALDFIPGLELYHRKICMLSDLEQPTIYSVEQFNSLKDRYTLYQTCDFADRVVQLCKEVSELYHLECAFEGIRYLRGYTKSPDDFSKVNIKEELRRAQIPMWIYGNAEFLHSHEIYERAMYNKNGTENGLPNPAVIEALGVLLLWRNWFETHASKLKTSSDYFSNNHIPEFIKAFGESGLGKLIWARRIIANYKDDALDQLTESGIIVPDTQKRVIWGNAGLSTKFSADSHEFSREFSTFYKAVQRWNLPVAKPVERELRWQSRNLLNLDSGVISMLEARAPLGRILSQWRDFGILSRLIPNFDQLESQLYDLNHRSDGFTKAARAIDRLNNLDRLEAANFSADSNQNFFLTLYTELSSSTLAALRLALLAEEIPKKDYALSGELPNAVAAYVDQELSTRLKGLSEESLALIKFLIENKRSILTAAEQCADHENIEKWLNRINNLGAVDASEVVRAMTLFAYAAFDYIPGEHVKRERLTPWQWQNLITLSENLLLKISGIDSNRSEEYMFSPDDLKICNNIPDRLKNSPLIRKFSLGAYGSELDPYRLNPVVNSIKALIKSERPVVRIFPNIEQDLAQAHIYTWDRPGLFWQIAQTFYELGASISYTHLYTILNAENDPISHKHRGQNIVYDLIRFKPRTNLTEAQAQEFQASLEKKLCQSEIHVANDHLAILERIADKMKAKLTQIGGMKYQFHYQHDDSPGILYAICRYLSEQVQADIFDILPASDHAYVAPIPTNIYFSSNLEFSAIDRSCGIFY